MKIAMLGPYPEAALKIHSEWGKQRIPCCGRLRPEAEPVGSATEPPFSKGERGYPPLPVGEGGRGVRFSSAATSTAESLAHVSGVDAVVVALVAGLAQRPDVALHVVTAIPGLSAAKVTRLTGFTLHQLPRARGGRLRWHMPLVRALQETIRTIQPDVVHAHGSGPYAAAAIFSDRPNVITLHGMVYREAALGWADNGWPARVRWLWDALYERWVMRKATDVIAISPYVAQEFAHLTRARFHAIENPVDDRFFAVPDEPAGQPNVLCVARVIPRKDILTLIRAFVVASDIVPTATLTIAGETDTDPDYCHRCQRLADELGVGGRVHFAGNLDRGALAAAYTASSLVALASRQETAPVTVAEALASSRPVVATRAGGVPFMVQDGETGRLAEVGDAATLGQQMAELLTDTARRQALGRRGREVARARFGLSSIVESTVALYSTLIAEKPDG